MSETALPPRRELAEAATATVAMPEAMRPEHGSIFGAGATTAGERVWLQSLQDIAFNDAGEVFDDSGVLEAWFPSPAAYAARDRARYERKHVRAMAGPTAIGAQCLWITDRFSHVYFHWLTDALPRLEAAAAAGLSGPVLLPARVASQPFIAETLAAWPQFRAVAAPAGNGFVHRIDLVTRSAIIQDLHPVLVRKAARRLTATFGGEETATAWRRIYVTRQHARHRRMADEEALRPVLAAHGFETLAMEQMPFAEQVRLMRETAILAGPHGAGLTNAMFMPSGGLMLELRQLEGPPLSFLTLASICGQRYRYGECGSAEPDQHPHGADVTIGPDALAELLTAAIAAHRK